MGGTTMDFFTDDELVDELARRYPRGLVVGGIRDAKGNVDNGDESIHFWHRNGFTACIGICERLKHGMLDDATRRNEYDSG